MPIGTRYYSSYVFPYRPTPLAPPRVITRRHKHHARSGVTFPRHATYRHVSSRWRCYCRHVSDIARYYGGASSGLTVAASCHVMSS